MYCTVSYIMALIAATQVSTQNTSSAKETDVSVPRIYGISRDYLEGPTIHWLLDDNGSQDETVLGYKIRLWQVGCDRKPKYQIVDGRQVRRKNVMPKLQDYSTLRNLTEFMLEGANSTHLALKDIEPDVPYHMTVAAYGAGREGPPSRPFRFQHRGRYTCREI